MKPLFIVQVLGSSRQKNYDDCFAEQAMFAARNARSAQLQFHRPTDNYLGTTYDYVVYIVIQSVR